MSDPVWSKAETHCVWCGKRRAVQADWNRHKDAAEEYACNQEEADHWCADLCWLDACVEGSSQDAVVHRLRAENEAQAAVITRYRDRYGATVPVEVWWRTRVYGEEKP